MPLKEHKIQVKSEGSVDPLFLILFFVFLSFIKSAFYLKSPPEAWFCSFCLFTCFCMSQMVQHSQMQGVGVCTRVCCLFFASLPNFSIRNSLVFISFKLIKNLQKSCKNNMKNSCITIANQIFTIFTPFFLSSYLTFILYTSIYLCFQSNLTVGFL